MTNSVAYNQGYIDGLKHAIKLVDAAFPDVFASTKPARKRRRKRRTNKAK